MLVIASAFSSLNAVSFLVCSRLSVAKYNRILLRAVRKVKGQAEPLGVSILLIKGLPNTVVFCSALLKTADNNIVVGRCMAR